MPVYSRPMLETIRDRAHRRGARPRCSGSSAWTSSASCWSVLPRPRWAISLRRSPSISRSRCGRRPARSRRSSPPRWSLPPLVREARVEGAGYLNFFLDRGRFVAALLGGAPAPAPRPGKVIVEHTNINPNKAAHIGHLRNAVLGDVLVRTLRHLGHAVEVQNYLDDTGVQVADVVAGLIHLQGIGSVEAVRTAVRERRLPDGEVNPKGFAYLCWDLYAEVGRIYAARPETQGLAPGGPPRDRGRRQRDRADRRRRRRGRDLGAPRHDGPPRHRLRPAAARERHPATSTSGPRLRAAQGVGRDPLRRPRASTPGCWVLPLDGVRGVRRHGGARQDPGALERHRDLHRQGHRLPALEVRPAADRLRLHALLAGLELGRGPRGGDSGRRARASRSGGAPTPAASRTRPSLRPRASGSSTSSTCASPTSRRS